MVIRQKETNTHTRFMVLPGGRCFPNDNYLLARRWWRQGLLDTTSRIMMHAIQTEQRQRLLQKFPGEQ